MEREVISGPGAMPGVIGHYHLLQKIGEGGMGEVWLAEQKEPVRRRVAVKLVKAGMNTREVMARFESERQALALMDHPAIAKVLDAGSSPGGAPFFVMEYVAGVPITTYCDNHRLTTVQRLELFMHVCDGVQHAHQKAIIHRDLKPTNILIAEVDGTPFPKIIDFGVAKALSQKLTPDTLLTRLGVLVGTPEYMSPEQASSSGEDIDTRTDVYSLGIIFYELLAGTPPLDLRKITLEEFLRRLREEDALKPSTKIRTQDAAAATAVAHQRQTEPPILAKQLRGDLDAIALKALEKNRSRRYGSPSDFAADIGRYLKNQPVLAVAPSVRYRLRKFTSRYRAVLVTACAFLVVLVVAAGVSLRESLRANQEAAASQAVNDFLQNDLLAQASAANQSGPGAKPDPDLKVRTALDRAAARITGKFDQQPEVEAAIRDTIGQTYMDLGLYAEARTQLERALELHRRALGTPSPKTLKTMSRLGWTVSHLGDTRRAQDLLSEAVKMQRRVLGIQHPDTLTSMYFLANAVYFHNGKYAQAETLYKEILEIQRRVLGPEHPDTLSSMSALADVYIEYGRYAQAEEIYRQALEIRSRVLGAEHPMTLFSMTILAVIYIYRGQYAEAEELSRRTLQIQERLLGPEHQDTLTSMDDLADAYTGEGKYDQAEALFTRTLRTSRRVLGDENPLTLALTSDFASMYQRQGQFGLAEHYAAAALASQRHSLGLEHPATMASAADLALAYLSQRNFPKSEPLAREALDFFQHTQPDDWQRFRAESLVGANLAGGGKYAEAELLLLQGYRGLTERKDRIQGWYRYHLDYAHQWLIQLYRAWGQPDKAAEWQQH